MLEGVDTLNLDAAHEALSFYESTALGSRKVGIYDEQRLGEALADPRTITGFTNEGTKIAVLVPLEYADGAGYDVERCREHIVPEDGKDTAMVYLSSGGMLQRLTTDSYQGIVDGIRSLGHSYILSSNDVLRSSQNAKDELSKLLDDAGLKHTTDQLIDPDSSEHYQGVDVSLFGIDMPKKGEPSGVVTWEDFYATYSQGISEGRYSNDVVDNTVLMRGQDLSSELTDEMWQIYENRFKWLGENHPVSTEDTKAAFLKLATNPNSLCLIRFKDAHPVCFTYLLNDPSELYWLNPSFLRDKASMKMDPNQILVFFPGIVSGEAGANYSADVVRLAANIAFDTGAACKVVFENTNKSEQYIPRIVKENLESVNRGDIGNPEVLDRTAFNITEFSTD